MFINNIDIKNCTSNTCKVKNSLKTVIELFVV